MPALDVPGLEDLLHGSDDATAAALFSLVLAGIWISEAGSMRDALAWLGAFPFVPLQLAGAVMGLVVMALMWWTTSEA